MNNTPSISPSSLDITLFYLLASSVSILLLLVVFLILTRCFSGLIIGKKSLFGEDRTTKILSFGIAFILEPQALPNIIELIIRLISAFANEIPEQLLLNWRQRISLCEYATTLTTCTGEMGLGYFESLGIAIQNGLNASNIRTFPFWQVFSFIVYGAIAAQIIQYINKITSNNSNTTTTQESQVNRFTMIVTRINIQNLLFFLVLGFGLYLSLVSILTIPDLTNVTAFPVELSANNLREQLDEI